MTVGLPPDSIAPTDTLTAALILSDGQYFLGSGVGRRGQTDGELCFTTSMTGYQETITDPSYAGQLITFTAPHIGNVGTTPYDNESDPTQIHCRGVIMRNPITPPANFRSEQSFDAWLSAHGITGITGIDTRALTRHMSQTDPQHACIIYPNSGEALPINAIYQRIKNTGNLAGRDLTPLVSPDKAYNWANPSLSLELKPVTPRHTHAYRHAYRVVVIDYGCKQAILRQLVDTGFTLDVVGATATYDDIMKYEPDGVFLSNGPGDPMATASHATPVIQALLAQKMPIFGICLGNQLLAQAIAIGTYKMTSGHRGVNHPVQDCDSKVVHITSQNHGFCVNTVLPDTVKVTHRSLFDNSIEGIHCLDRPAFSVQFHPESSPGPHDCHHLFQKFYDLIANRRS